MRQATASLPTPSTVRQIESRIAAALDQVFAEVRAAVEALVRQFVVAQVTPKSTFEFEKLLAEAVRELGRQVVERVFNLLEGDRPQQLPHDVEYEGGGYRRLNRKTRNAHVATLFGSIVLWRHPYRYWRRDVAEKCIFPLEIRLGLRCGASPALAEAAARYLAQAGATQQAVLDRLRSQHGVALGVKRLRDLTAELSELFAALTPEAQTGRLLELLHVADKSKGNRKPVLAVGRDGVTLRNYGYGFFETATVGTLTVYDRAGNRLGSVYLGFVPELGQHTPTARLTALIEAVLRGWEGPLPRLCYGLVKQ